MKKITARFESTCKICNEPIHRGMDICWEKGKGAFHISCWDNLENGEDNNSAHSRNTHNYYQKSGIIVPKFLRAREKYQGYQVRFYETLAIPEEVMTVVCDDNLYAEELRRYSQWRIDFPDTSASHVDDNIRQILVVAHKILTRGKFTLVSPFLEDKLRERFCAKEFDHDSNKPENYLAIYKHERETNVWLDGSGSEKKFLEDILYNSLGAHYRHSVIPQVYLSSLIDEVQNEDSAGEQRVDFLVTTQNKKIVIELDGEDHIGHEERDLERDNLLQRWGYDVLRIPNTEIETGEGIHLDALKELLESDVPAINSNISESGKYAIATKMADQIQVTVLEALLVGLLDFDTHHTVHFDTSSVYSSKSDIEFVLNESIADLNNLLMRLGKLYECADCIRQLTPSVSPTASTAQGIVISAVSTNRVSCF